MSSSRELVPKTMRQSVANMAEIVMPNDTNPHGTLSGGRLMHFIDIAAGISAIRHCCSKVVTAAVDNVSFHAPIPLGYVVELTAMVTFAGRTSVEVKVMVRGEDPQTGERFHTTTAHVVFVAIDDEGQPIEVPPLIAETEEDEAIIERARKRRERRLKHRERPEE